MNEEVLLDVLKQVKKEQERQLWKENLKKPGAANAKSSKDLILYDVKFRRQVMEETLKSIKLVVEAKEEHAYLYYHDLMKNQAHLMVRRIPVYQRVISEGQENENWQMTEEKEKVENPVFDPFVFFQ